jgi:predicted enzyme related to lactoylglutathione lyase
MPERTSHAPGTPSWVDIGTDVEAAKTFYTGLFGWDTEDAGPVEVAGGYGFFTQGGKAVAGYGPQQNPGPPFWSTYVTVADVDVTTKAVEAAGGTVLVAPMDVMDAGRMAVYLDSGGAAFSAWQPLGHIGAQLVNEPVSMCWTELNTRDVEGAKTFYASVFGWEAVTGQDEGPMPYVEFKVEGESIAGMMSMPPHLPAEVPPHWLVYFAVDDTDSTIAKATELGGVVHMEPMEIPEVGRFAVLGDPQGAVFAVIKMARTTS